MSLGTTVAAEAGDIAVNRAITQIGTINRDVSINASPYVDW